MSELQERFAELEATHNDLLERRRASAVLEVTGIPWPDGKNPGTLGATWDDSEVVDVRSKSARRLANVITATATARWMMDASNWPPQQRGSLNGLVVEGLSRPPDIVPMDVDCQEGSTPAVTLVTPQSSKMPGACDKLTVARVLLPPSHPFSPLAVVGWGVRKPIYEASKVHVRRFAAAIRAMHASLDELAVTGVAGERTRALALLKEALEPKPSVEQRGYSFLDLCADMRRDIAVLNRSGKLDPKYRRAARSLESFVAHRRTGLSLAKVAKVLGITIPEARAARLHAELKYAGAAVSKAVFTRNCIPADVAAHLAGHRVSHAVCDILDASIRNSMAKTLLARKLPIPELHSRYLQECSKLGISRPLKLRKYQWFLTASAFTVPKAESACCEWCLEFLDEAFASIRALIDEVCLCLDGMEKRDQLRKMHKTVSVSIRRGEFASHQSNGHSECLMHDILYALSDPHDARLAEDCDHELSMSCPSCNGIFYLRAELEAVIDYVELYCDVDDERIAEFRSRADEYFGMRGVLRGMGHLVRDRRQSQCRKDSTTESPLHLGFASYDYCSKLDRERHVMGKSEGYGSSKVSLQGFLLIMKVPPPDTPNVRWEFMPKGAKEGKPELQASRVVL